MERLHAALDLSDDERVMIDRLHGHGVVASDLSRSLTPSPTDDLDVRYTILAHLFILGVCDGVYDARSRVALRSVAGQLGVDWKDVVRVECAIAARLRVHEHAGDVGATDAQGLAVGERNARGRGARWAALGLAALAGGAVVGVTAGLAAPLIASGLGAALTMVGVSGGVGVGAFMGGSTGVALIATGGALTGGGMSGFRMMRRTRGISQFEFVSIDVALVAIAEHRARRAEEKKKKKSRRARWRSLRDGGSARGTPATGSGMDTPTTAAGTSGTATPKAATAAAATAMPSDFSCADSVGKSRQSSAETNLSLSEVLRDSEGNVINTRAMPRLTGPQPDPSNPEGGVGTGEVGVAASKVDRDLLWETESAFSDGTDPEVFDPVVTTGVILPEQLSSSDLDAASARGEDDGADDPNDADDRRAAVLESQRRTRNPSTKPAQTNVLITVAGWVTTRDPEDDFTLPFSTLARHEHGDHHSLVWETQALVRLGSAMKMLVGEVTGFLLQQGIQTFLLPSLMAGLTGPLWLLKFAGWLDNPWAVGLSKAKKAGLVLADTLLANVQEGRPVTLVGFSLGAKVIFHCLQELASRGAVGHGIVEQAYLFGCPVIATPAQWEPVSGAVAGRLVNGYMTNDWILGLLYRTSAGASWKDVAGMRPVVGVPGVENICLDAVIKGHLDYRGSLPLILRHAGFAVESDVFEEEEEEEDDEGLKGGAGDEVPEAGLPPRAAPAKGGPGIPTVPEPDCEEMRNVSSVIVVDGVGRRPSGDRPPAVVSLQTPPAGMTATTNAAVGALAKPSPDETAAGLALGDGKRGPRGIRGWFSRRLSRGAGKPDVPGPASAGTAGPSTAGAGAGGVGLAQRAASLPATLGKTASDLEEEEEERRNVLKIMESYWAPREVPSTLPPLVIPLTEEEKRVAKIDREAGAIVEEYDEADDISGDFTPGPAADFEAEKVDGREVDDGDLGSSATLAAGSRTDVRAPTPVSPRGSAVAQRPPSGAATAGVTDGEDTRRRAADPIAGRAGRWDGYQGPLPLSNASSSCDIGSGVELENVLGALPVLGPAGAMDIRAPAVAASAGMTAAMRFAGKKTVARKDEYGKTNSETLLLKPADDEDGDA
ncbi:hypothetical protein HK101_009058 [Irineochytrium annulatum]|nr:hypothetical protein HK101_009058 [Irineochytrium annulatum]